VTPDGPGFGQPMLARPSSLTRAANNPTGCSARSSPAIRTRKKRLLRGRRILPRLAMAAKKLRRLWDHNSGNIPRPEITRET